MIHRFVFPMLPFAKAVTLLCIVSSLVGCAGQMAFRAGNQLALENRPEDALRKYEEAAQIDPNQPEYRVAAVNTRERVVQQYLGQARVAIAARDGAAARTALGKALAIDPLSERARNLLADVDTEIRSLALLEEASAALARKDFEGAQERLRQILIERPGHPQALALQRSLPETAATTAETQLAATYRKPLSIEFRDATIKQVFEVISRSSGLNILFDKDVRTDQKMSIILKNSSVEAALHYALSTNQLERRTLDANTILVFPNNPQKQKDYQDLLVRTFYLTNADAKTVAAALKSVLKTREVVPDDKLNLLIVRDSAEAIRLAEKLITILDVPDAEVMLEVEILEVKRSKLTELGVRWPDSVTLTPLAAVGSGNLTLQDLRDLNSSRIGATVSPISITARKQDGDTNILANPRIRVRNREKARILIGDRVPNITSTATSTGFVSESITYIDVGLKLEVEPTIYMDGAVSIKVGLEVSNIVSQVTTKSGSLAYQIGTRNATTVLKLNDGENQILAGLINDEDRRTGNKVPLLGDVPVVGRLFGSQTENTQKTEIILSITPRVVRNVTRAPLNLIEFASGTETTIRARPDLIGPALVSAPSTPMQSIGSESPLVPSSRDAGSLPNAIPGSGASLPVQAPVPVASPSEEMAAAPSMALRGPKSVRAGETFAVELMWNEAAQVTGFAMSLGFDTARLEVVRVTDGGVLEQDGKKATFVSSVVPIGMIMLSGTRPTGPSVVPKGKVATVEFRAKAQIGETKVYVNSVDPVVPAGSPPPTRPSPATLSLQVN